MPFIGLIFVYWCSFLTASRTLLSFKVYKTRVTRVHNRFSSVFQANTSNSALSRLKPLLRYRNCIQNSCVDLDHYTVIL